MSLQIQIASLATRIANYTRDSILPRLLPTGGANLQLLRKTTSAYEWFSATSDAIGEGTTNLYFTLTRMLSSVLTGLSTATSTAIAATDTVLVAFGKLQAQVTLRAPLASPTLTGTPLAPTALLTVDNTQIATTAHAQGLASASQINSQVVGYTLVLADKGKTIFHPSSDTTARTFAIPANASVAMPIGTVITFDNDIGAGVVTIAINTDTLVLVGTGGATGSRTLASGGRAVAQKVASTRWRISGINLT